MKKTALLLSIVVMFILAACSGSNSSPADAEGVNENGEWTPSRSIEFVAPAGAGGGWDTTARMLARVLEEEGIADQSFGVVNKPGGGGAVGWAYVHNRNDPHHVFVASPPLMFIPLNGQSEFGHEDFTPIANLIADYGAFAVRADAKWENLSELFEDMVEDPTSVSVIGTSSPGSMDHMQFVNFAEAAGVDITQIRYVSEQEGGTLTALLNGSVDVLSTGVSEAVEQARAGEIRILGITAPERLEGEFLSELPTGIEQGIDAEFVNWRGVFGPPDMTPEQVKYFEDLFREASESEAFAEIRNTYGWEEFFMGSEEYGQFLDEQKNEIQGLLERLGFDVHE
ncbi:tripartite tricarboxylate transporter substrate binding protein [Halalkalibacterium ligniniphilum]|uniref:tripartite tricarboxylate transporter substrate binding protein n=1 Tax=Halalkalibacterium ligniniphilum TaxID=1134413 RepID=UPI00034C88F2|nr:tripartite tricarboxylate transporter substrate binding protein [Halalkalibacterium ligniniphilum]